MNESLPTDNSRAADRRAWLGAMLIALVTFAAIAPTLRWPQFTGGNENIVVATALEMRRGGPWLVPELNGEPRVKKPPLVAWITAATLRQHTIDQLDSPDPSVRSRAYVDLAWQVRWTGVLAGCVMIVATFALARAIEGNAVGLAAAMIVATNLLFMKFMRQSTTDVHLAMWVTIANASFVHALLRARWWPAMVVGAGATAMAFLCKGPVALLETVLPLIVCAAFIRRTQPREAGLANRPTLLQGVVGVLIFALVALPWFVHVLMTVPGVWQTWFAEVTREGATDLSPGSPALYFMIGPAMWPWLVFGVIGCVVIAKDRLTPHRLIPVLQVVLPLAIMIWFRDRKDRYLLPMIGPAATICAMGLVAWARDWRSRDATRFGRERWVLVIHTLLLLGGGLGLAWVGGRQPTVDGGQWWPAGMSVMLSVVFVVLCGMGLFLQRRRAWAMAGATFAVMLLLQAAFMFGYRRDASGASAYAPLAQKIRNIAPDADFYDWAGPDKRVNEELAIYLNRAIRQADPETLRPAADRPTVVLIRRHRDEPAPTLAPVWQPIGSATEKKQTWWAYLLHPAARL